MFQYNCGTSFSAEIIVCFIQAAVTVLESNGLAQLTVAITMPVRADPIELSFFLLVNTLDGTATGLLPSLKTDLYKQEFI